MSCVCGWSSGTSTVSRPAMVVDYGELERERARQLRWEEAGSPTAAESIAKMKAILRRPRPTTRQRWERILQDPHAPFISKEYAREALKRPREILDREPGSDDELVPVSQFAA